MDDLSNRTLTMERVLKAPLDLVWEAWSQPQHITSWWGPKGMKTKVNKHDFQEGGEWEYVMAMPDGSEFIADGIYKEIIPKQTIISSANFKPMTEGVEIQAYFEEDDGKTKFTFSVVHQTVAYKEQQEEMGFHNGWASVFDRLEEFLSATV